MKTELSPCPFCGGKARRKHGKYNPLGAYGTPDADITWYAVYCTDCKVSQCSRTYYSREASDDAWNNRSGGSHGNCN